MTRPLNLHLIIFIAITSMTWLLSGCSSQEGDPSTPNKTDDVTPLFSLLSPDQTNVHFANVLTESPQINVLTYQYYHNGAGVAVGDINNDGLPDIYFTGNMSPNALYLNKGNMRFEEIGRQAGVGGKKGWTTGVTMVDINNDGWLDIYVCRSGNLPENYRANILFINNGDLTFSEKAAEYGLDDKGFGTQAAFFDYDLDGDLDMYLLNHAITPSQQVSFQDMKYARDPFAGDKLFRNDEGKFTDVSAQAGIISNSIGYGLGVAISDLNDDGWPDIYVCNDYLENDYLYFNNGDGTFTESIHESVKHISNFSMGVDIADFNNDGLPDIMVADMAAEDNYRSKANMSGMNPERFWKAVEYNFHYQYMINTLQLNNGNGSFSEIAQLAKVEKTDWSWAPLLADFDNDGYKDLLVTNGLRKEARNNDFVKVKKSMLKTFEQAPDDEKSGILKQILDTMPEEPIRNYIFRNNGDLTFTKKIDEWGFHEKSWSNGAAYADLDNDGDLDIVISNIDSKAFIYENHADQTTGNNFIRIRLKGPERNRLGLGAKLTVTCGDNVQSSELYLTRGYLSSVENLVHFGVGNAQKADEVRVEWPDGKSHLLHNISVNKTIEIDHGDAKPENIPDRKKSRAPLFSEVTDQAKITFQHRENEFDDFARELLLPHKLSNLGPGVAVQDVNGDGLEDFFVGGAKDQAGILYLQQADNTFTVSGSNPWEQDKESEDIGAIFFDADGDHDPDLYVASGGNEFDINAPELQDRLYINDGNGKFSKSPDALPVMPTSSSCAAAADYDQDGDLDLFIGGRLIPGKYPFPARSYLLENDNGKFTDVTAVIAPALVEPGLVTAALWTDFNDDDQPDLIVAGEWMPLMMMSNEAGRLKDISAQSGMQNITGWWFSLAHGDFDHDGDLDYVAGNLGLNYKYKAGKEAPFEIYCHDFDRNGSFDIVLGYYNDGNLFPVRGKQCSSEQMPFISEKFPTYDAFAKATLGEVYQNDLNVALHYKADNFASSYIENLGGGKFSMHSLPIEAQISSVNGILPVDVNNDGLPDIVLAGNLYASEVETIRNDAGTGLVLTGNGKGSFRPTRLIESGFFADGDIKSLATIKLGDGDIGVLAAGNNGRIKLFRKRSSH